MPIDKIREDLREPRLTLSAETLAHEEIRRRTGRPRIDNPSPLSPLPPRVPRTEVDAGIDQASENAEQISPDDLPDEDQPSAFDIPGQILKVHVWIGFTGFIFYWIQLFAALVCWGPDHAVRRF